MTNSNAVVVRRASHCQNTPQVSRPQSAPMTRVTATNAVPNSALAPATRSQPSGFDRRLNSTIADAIAVTTKAR